MGYYLGIDVGASKTHALIADETGNCLGFGKAWGGNPQAVGYDGLADALQGSFEQAGKMADVTIRQVAGAGFGVAGYDFPSERDALLETIARLGLSCPLDLMNDGANGLLAGTSHGIGVSVTAGTGINCRGRGPDGREGRIVGNGIQFGEFGGGGEIAWKGLHMVNYAWIKRIPPTALTRIYLEATGAQDELDLMEGLSNNRYYLFPFIAIEIFEAARAGDLAAREVLRFSGEELGWLAVSVIRQIGMEDDEVEVVQSGSVFEGGELICKPMREVLLKHVPKARLIRLDGPPVVGPVILGMQMAGLDGFAVRQRLIQTAKEMVKE
jgi:N-acetylglucosamine kinase-like BadF-type ATPase